MEEKGYWVCIIGPMNSSDIRPDANKVLKSALKEAFVDISGSYPEVVISNMHVSEKKEEELEDMLRNIN
jgi:hypothetical protein